MRLNIAYSHVMLLILHGHADCLASFDLHQLSLSQHCALVLACLTL